MLETVKAKAGQGPTSNGFQLHALPDPLGLYQTFIKANPDSTACQVVPPPFYDETNTIIPPAQYGDRLNHLAPVVAEGTLRLYVSRHIVLSIC